MTPETIVMDTHLHTTVSDGTDSPVEILDKIKAEGIGLFSLTDHDAVKGCRDIAEVLTASDPLFISGVEFNTRDREGKYHILGYGFDPDTEEIRRIVDKVRNMRMEKLGKRLEALKTRFGFSFSSEDVEALYALYNPGKPHIGNLMVKYGFAKTKDEAIGEYLNSISTPNSYIPPEEAIESISAAGGIPMLAHPPYGSGDERIMGDELDERVKRLMSFGLQGVEGFYSQYTRLMRDQVLQVADKYDLYVSAGSDYHGKNKLVILGDTGLEEVAERPRGLIRFIERAGSLLTKVR